MAVENSKGAIVSLYNCNEVENGKGGYTICFDSLITDSRCPEGAVCVWQGDAIIKVSFHENNNTHKFKMVIPNFIGMGAVHDTTINGYKIVFTDLQPYPKVNTPTPAPDQIKASFTINY